MQAKKLSYETLAGSSDDLREEVLLQGTAPAFEELEGWEFRGYNVSAASELIRARKFKKGFYADPTNPAMLLGYNVKVEQNGLLNPWIDQLQHGAPVRHALYAVYPVRADEKDKLYPNALMLNYGMGQNPPFDPSRVLRDYLVQVSVDNSDLLLGKAYAALGPLRTFGGWFILERYNKRG
jgi:hypothetical protein